MVRLAMGREEPLRLKLFICQAVFAQDGRIHYNIADSAFQGTEDKAPARLLKLVHRLADSLAPSLSD